MSHQENHDEIEVMTHGDESHSGYHSDDESPEDHRDRNGKGTPRSRTSFYFGLCSLRSGLFILPLLVLLTCDILLYQQNRRLRLAANDHGFTGIYALGKTWDQFHTYTEYSDVNQTISDPAWDSFTTNGFVAIPHTEAAAYGLPLAEDFPDDSSKGVYVLGGFHELHCVIYLRNAIKDLMRGESVSDDLIHINHCYDALRQSIQCHADDTPLYAPYKSRLTGDGQFRRCRNWHALTTWAQEHTACWPTGHCADLGQ